jgi:hypothetical protein
VLNALVRGFEFASDEIGDPAATSNKLARAFDCPLCEACPVITSKTSVSSALDFALNDTGGPTSNKGSSDGLGGSTGLVKSISGISFLTTIFNSLCFLVFFL